MSIPQILHLTCNDIYSVVYACTYRKAKDGHFTCLSPTAIIITMIKYKCKLLKHDPVYRIEVANVYLQSFKSRGATLRIYVEGAFKDPALRDTIAECNNKTDKRIFELVGDMVTAKSLYIKDLVYNLHDDTFSATLCSDILR